MGIDGGIGLQLGEIPADFGQKFKSALAPIGEGKDCTAIVHHQRETKSDWELEMMRGRAQGTTTNVRSRQAKCDSWCDRT